MTVPFESKAMHEEKLKTLNKEWFSQIEISVIFHPFFMQKCLHT